MHVTRAMTSMPIARAIRGSAIAPVFASLLLSVLALGALASRPPAALGLSCIQPAPVPEAVAQAEIAFVGTVTGVANEGRWATVSVEEIWRGPDMPPVVEVHGGGPNPSDSLADRTFTVGTRYLFFPFVDQGVLTDNICSSTAEFTPEVSYRPPEFRTPTPGEPEPADPVAALGDIAVPVGGVALLAIVIIGGAMLASRRQA